MSNAASLASVVATDSAIIGRVRGRVAHIGSTGLWVCCGGAC